MPELDPLWATHSMRRCGYQGLLFALARLGYMDYSVLTPESMFTMNRPLASDDGLSASVKPGPWDGVYR